MEVREEYHSLIWDYIEKDVREAIKTYQIEGSDPPVQLTKDDVEKILVDAVFEESTSTVGMHAFKIQFMRVNLIAASS